MSFFVITHLLYLLIGTVRTIVKPNNVNFPIDAQISSRDYRLPAIVYVDFQILKPTTSAYPPHIKKIRPYAGLISEEVLRGMNLEEPIITHRHESDLHKSGMKAQVL
jgi:hypothetical protein